MSYNEQETRYYLIDPVLREKGYDAYSKHKLETPASVEAIGAQRSQTRWRRPHRLPASPVGSHVDRAEKRCPPRLFVFIA